MKLFLLRAYCAGFLVHGGLCAEILCFTITDRAKIALDDAVIDVVRLNSSDKVPQLSLEKVRGASQKCFELADGSIVKATISRRGFISVSYENILIKGKRGRHFTLALEFLDWIEDDFGPKRK